MAELFKYRSTGQTFVFPSKLAQNGFKKNMGKDFFSKFCRKYYPKVLKLPFFESLESREYKMGKFWNEKRLCLFEEDRLMGPGSFLRFFLKRCLLLSLSKKSLGRDIDVGRRQSIFWKNKKICIGIYSIGMH